jgi:hypothetical protein
MKRNVSAVLGAAVMVLWASAVSAQSKFDGKWAVDMEKTQASNPAREGGNGGRMGRMGGGMGGMTISITDNTLNVTRAGRNGENTTSYKLDGSDQAISMGQMEGKAKAKWTDDKGGIVVETTIERNGNAQTTKAEYRLEGEYLVLTSTRPGRDGGEMTTKQYFKKAN